MMVEAIRLSLAAEEERVRKASKGARKEGKKIAKEAKKEAKAADKAKADRLAAALRDNLKRRKAQARESTPGETKPAD